MSKVTYSEDVAKLKASNSELASLSDRVVELLYGRFSEDYYCASWLILDEQAIRQFNQWLDSESGD